MRPRDLLQLLADGEVPSLEDLTTFFEAHHKEGQYHDFKDGKMIPDIPGKKGNRETKDQKESAKAKIRAYTSAFANSDGGVLIIGVSENEPRRISPCPTSIAGTKTLGEWVADVLEGIAYQCSPPPRIREIPCPDGGSVLLVATLANPKLIHCVNRQTRRLEYHFRFHDKTLSGPEWLLGALLHGRLRRPELDLEKCEPEFRELQPYREGAVDFSFRLHNQGFTSANNVRLGLIVLQSRDSQVDLNPFLQSRIDINRCNEMSPMLFMSNLASLRPFESEKVRISDVRFLIPKTHDERIEGEFTGALFLISETSLPMWFELIFLPEFSYHDDLDSRSTEYKKVGRGALKAYELNRLESRRPRVSWRNPK